jgi:DNA-binding MarR family transcriptional regulator
VDESRDDAVQAIIDAQRTVFFALQAATTDLWLNLELTMNQLKALFSLSHYGDLTMSAFATTLNVGKASASVLVEQLVHRGLVARTEDPADRRRSVVRLTPDGLEAITRLRIGGEAPMRRWLHALSPDDFQALMRSSQVLAAVAADDVPRTASPDAG